MNFQLLSALPWYVSCAGTSRSALLSATAASTGLPQPAPGSWGTRDARTRAGLPPPPSPGALFSSPWQRGGLSCRAQDTRTLSCTRGRAGVHEVWGQTWIKHFGEGAQQAPLQPLGPAACFVQVQRPLSYRCCLLQAV